MDAGSVVELAHLSTGGVLPLGYDVWPPSTFLMEDVDSVDIYESGGIADGQFVVLAGVDVDEEGSGHDRGGFCRSTDSSGDVLGDMEEEARRGEGAHDPDGESELPEAENICGSDPVEVEGGRDLEPDMVRCGSVEPSSHSLIPVSLGGDQAMTECMKEEPLEQPLDAGNHVQRLCSWAIEFWQSERFNTISKQIKEELRDEERPVVDVVGRPVEIQENGGSRAAKVNRAEEQKQVSSSDQLMMHASEEPAHNLSASSDDSSDLLAGGVSSPAALSRLSWSPDAQPGCSNLVLLNCEELDKVVTEQVDECLEKDMRALLLPLEAKCSGLLAALRQNRWQTIQLSEQLSELILKEHREGQAQKHPSERGTRVSAPVSEFRMSRKKRCRWYPGTSWRRQVQKSRARRLWDSFYAKCASVAMTEHGHGEPDTDGSAEDSYQHDHLEVRGAAVAEFQQNCTGVRRPAVARRQSKQTFEVSRRRRGRDAPKERLPNQIPCEVEVHPGVPYTPESFWDAPYSIWMD